MPNIKASTRNPWAWIPTLYTAEGLPYVLEVNTLPGMTETSLLPKAAAVKGMDYATLCQRMVQLALKRATLAC